MQNRHWLQNHSSTNDHRPCSLVDDHLRLWKHWHLNRLDLREQLRDVFPFRNRKVNLPAVESMGDRPIQLMIDCLRYSLSRSKIGVVEQQREFTSPLQIQWDPAFHHRSKGHPCRIWVG